MNKIDEIALRVFKVCDDRMFCDTDTWVTNFAKALLADPELLAELSKDAEPTCLVSDIGVIQNITNCPLEPGLMLFTHPAPVVASEQRVAEAIAKFVSQGARDLAEQYGSDDMGSLSFGSGLHGEARFDRYNELMELDDDIRSGKWREYR